MKIACLTLVLAVSSAWPAAAQFEEVGPLPWRVGGKLGFTVDAAMFPDSAGRYLEIYVRLTAATMGRLVRDEAGNGRAKITARLKNAYGARQLSASQELEIAAADSAITYGKVVLLRLPTVPGAQQLRVTLEDLNSRKRGLLYMGRRVVESSKIEGEFEVPESDQGVVLSDPEFALTIEFSRGMSPFTRFGRRVVPNPERLYGLLINELRVFFVAEDEGDRTAPWRWEARVYDADDQVVASQDGQGPPGRFLHGHFASDVTDLLAGRYELGLQAWREGEAKPTPRRTPFSLGWRPETWVRNPRDVEDKVHFLLMPKEEEDFAIMHPGEQERLIDDFWLARDPSPETPTNEARERFLQRIDIANQRFTRRGLGRGMFSDMGRVFVRYGEPEEILREVIPTGDNTLSQILEELSATEERAIGEVRTIGPGGDMRPFEVWIYEGEIPVPPDADPSVERIYRGRRLVFLFVDDHGLGDYRLRYSTE